MNGAVGLITLRRLATAQSQLTGLNLPLRQGRTGRSAFNSAVLKVEI